MVDGKNAACARDRTPGDLDTSGVLRIARGGSKNDRHLASHCQTPRWCWLRGNEVLCELRCVRVVGLNDEPVSGKRGPLDRSALERRSASESRAHRAWKPQGFGCLRTTNGGSSNRNRKPRPVRSIPRWLRSAGPSFLCTARRVCQRRAQRGSTRSIGLDWN